MDLKKNDWKNNNPNPLIDMSGAKINMLTVLYRAESVRGRTMWHCKCDCGKELDIWAPHLKKGQYSCGCAKSKIISQKMTKHGGTDTKLFRLWIHMKERCSNPNHKSYKDYGGRGISVCPEWKDFPTFRDWAISKNYEEDSDFMKCTLDRIDVDGDYSPDNCRFVSMKEQCNNRRNNHWLIYKGEEHTIAQWSELLDIPQATLYKRVELGWREAQILGFEPRKGARIKSKFRSYEEYKGLVV